MTTPKLSAYSGIEPFIDALSIHNETPDEERLYLITSPEFSLKKMLALYTPQEKGIFEISSSYRKERKSRLHHLEFTMLEWYERSSHYLNLAGRMDDLILRLKDHLPETEQKDEKGIKSNLVTVEGLFSDILNIKVRPDSDAGYYTKIALSLGIKEIDVHSVEHPDHNMERSDHYIKEWLKAQYFQLIFDNFLFPHLKKGIWHVHDFPPFLRGMAALNKIGWAERIECFYNGIEISSGYQELFTITELKTLWEYNNQIRKLEKKTPHKTDELLIKITPSMKGVAGIAVGIERLLMAMFGIRDIKHFFWP